MHEGSSPTGYWGRNLLPKAYHINQAHDLKDCEVHLMHLLGTFGLKDVPAVKAVKEEATTTDNKRQ
jgi:hypothetical protein